MGKYDKILVTGGAGFIGSHLVDYLCDKLNKEVIVLDNLDPQVHGNVNKPPEFLNKKAKFIRGDVSNYDLVSYLIKDVDAVIHLAAAVGVGQSMYKIRYYVNTNCNGTASILEALVNEPNDVKKFIVASSMSAYGEGLYECPEHGKLKPPQRTIEQLKKKEWELKCPKCNAILKPLPTRESVPFETNSIYAQTKKDQEEMSLMIGKVYGFKVAACRFFNVFGSRQSLSNPYTGVCAIFSARIKNKKPPLIFEDGKQSRDFIHIFDLVKGIGATLENDSFEQDKFNIGTGRQITILQVAEELCNLLDPSIKPKVTNEYRPGDVRHCFADISKLQKLGYKPTMSFREGLEELFNWSKDVKAVDKTDEAFKELFEKIKK